MQPVKQISITQGMTVTELVREMQESGVMGAGRIAKAATILQKMFEDRKCKIFFGLAGAMVPGGMKDIIIDMLKSGAINIFVTTGANLTHDLVEAMGFRHYQGTHQCDDAQLHDAKIDRIYDSYMPNEAYEKLEDFFREHFGELAKTTSIKEFLWKLGSLVPGESSILKVCYEKKIPVFCPAISDSGIGLMMCQLTGGKQCDVKAFEDLKEMLDIAWGCKKAGVFYIGGGVPKNYIQQAMQLSPKSAEYGIQITMDRPEPGGSSGAELREGISWGKMNREGEYVDVICDATIALPLIWAAVKPKQDRQAIY